MKKLQLEQSLVAFVKHLGGKAIKVDIREYYRGLSDTGARAMEKIQLQFVGTTAERQVSREYCGAGKTSTALLIPGTKAWQRATEKTTS